MFIFQQNSFLFEYSLNVMVFLILIKLFFFVQKSQPWFYLPFFSLAYMWKVIAKDFANITPYSGLISPSGYIAWFGGVILAIRQWSSFLKYLRNFIFVVCRYLWSLRNITHFRKWSYYIRNVTNFYVKNSACVFLLHLSKT